VDEDFLVGSPCLGARGICSGIPGAFECADPGRARCSADPGGSTTPAGNEECNGADDDCDGEPDNGLGPRPSAEVRGRCADNQQVCNGEAGYQDLPGNYVPIGEVCNGLDDDCNGDVDDGLGVGDECAGRQGVCSQAAGTVECLNDVPVCSTDPGGTQAATTPEECNGLDDDCDGDTDEDFDGPNEPEACNPSDPDFCSHHGDFAACDTGAEGVEEVCVDSVCLAPAECGDSSCNTRAPSFARVGQAGFDLVEDVVDELLARDRGTELEWEVAPAEPSTRAAATTRCAELRYGGHDDWRLPDNYELLSLVNFGDPTYGVLGYAAFRAGDPETRYWSATTATDGRHFVLDLQRREDLFLPRLIRWTTDTPENRVQPSLCVRGGRAAELPVPRFVAVQGDDDALRDELTGLEWRLTVPSNGDPQSDYGNRQAFCGGFGRVPAAGELLTLIDYSRPDGEEAVFHEAFAGGGGWERELWTEHLVWGDDRRAIQVRTTTGTVDTRSASSDTGFRCVR